ncbi:MULTISPECIES: 4-hydroxythreonine-4-phosphate dehydrogenase PdxA [Fischerella]|uniref:4-hydroxythreonine-4-phosphate dehydrogenase n=1 Tax=Fischerella muscicola CCMEE 5323 TaxID=2019572 RepID=A0A2N6K0I9_FISMU|nr:MULTISPECIES: 4-hydroxythreonine-4-phosphate dehydrogenase PdxA [Fischerella]MBD2430920.1 4-hydroxythreonine-4-phosphate dehydrogenase PdxA [Fischerella sp. FACHB-380]PLZ87445.1 4-hydroxythreonine-4-phosphate dehydrogenase PdxA [Fischerella muscicola CCMEE 5323]
MSQSQSHQNNLISLPQDRPRLALTLGDPAGIGPEVILKALADPEISKNFDVTVVGSQDLLLENYTKVLVSGNLVPLANPENLSILDVALEEQIKSEILIGIGNAASGAASFAYLERAIAYTQKGEFDAIVTAPIAKSAWKAAGYDYPGQTELLAEKSGTDRYGMLFVARSPHTDWTLRCLLVTTHIPLCQVPEVLTPELLTKKLDLLVECLEKDFGLDSGKIAIAGLNPHSGEQGQLGREEQNTIIPWLEQERQKRPQWHLDGPIPPDTMWVDPGKAWYSGVDSTKAAEAYLALYHDQGLIPVKLMAFDRAVNTSIGLPFIRTSPDHGTAFNIAGQGIADATSMKAAIKLAGELARVRVQRRGGEMG